METLYGSDVCTMTGLSFNRCAFEMFYLSFISEMNIS
jgi:hypothetical protein